MINAFPKSRCVAWTGGAVLGAAAGISAWLYMAGRAASLFNRAIVALLAAFIAVNIALYIARLMAAREYQKRLLLLYEALDPSAFLQALLPLRKKGWMLPTAAPRWCILPTDISTAVSRSRHWRCWKMCSRRRRRWRCGVLWPATKLPAFWRRARWIGRRQPWTSCGALQQTGTAKGIRTKGAPYAGLSAALHGYCPGKARRCGSASKGF